jgi:hypothetical protein
VTLMLLSLTINSHSRYCSTTLLQQMKSNDESLTLPQPA